MQFDSTTTASLASVTTRYTWCTTVQTALGSGFKAVWRTSADAAVVTATFAGQVPITSDNAIEVTAAPTAVSVSAGTIGKFRLESADGTRWMQFGRIPRFVDGTGAVLTPAAGHGLTINAAITAKPPASLENLPAWLDGVATLTWTAISGTAMTDTGSGAGITAYSGATQAANTLIVNGGGHDDYSGNEVIALDLNDPAPAWSTIGAATSGGARDYATTNDGYYSPDGKPTARHTYWSIQYNAANDRMMLYGNNGIGNPLSHWRTVVDGFHVSTGTWDAKGTYTALSAAASTGEEGFVQDGDSRIWRFHAGDGNLYRIDLSTGTETNCGALTGSVATSTPVVYDSSRNRLVRPTTLGIDQVQMFALAGYSSGIPTMTTGTLSGAGATNVKTTCSWVYCADRDSYLAIKFQDTGATVYEINPTTWAVSTLSLSGTAPSFAGLSVDAKQNYYGRWAYFADLSVVVLAHRADGNVMFFRTA